MKNQKKKTMKPPKKTIKPPKKMTMKNQKKMQIYAVEAKRKHEERDVVRSQDTLKEKIANAKEKSTKH